MAASDNIKQNIRLDSLTIYEVISYEAQEELSRPTSALIWSGFVAGIIICFSVFCEGILKLHLPAGQDNFLIYNLGYIVGFLFVILGRFQLFTENTITVILPLLERFRMKRLTATAKLWTVVLLANFAGTFLVALLVLNFNFFSPALVQIFLEISEKAVIRDPWDIFIQAIPAGFLIAALVWMIPNSKNAKFWVICLTIYIIAIGDFAHVVAGSHEAFLLLLNDPALTSQAFIYLLAAGTGNIIGGTGLFSLMVYAQVRQEM